MRVFTDKYCGIMLNAFELRGEEFVSILWSIFAENCRLSIQLIIRMLWCGGMVWWRNGAEWVWCCRRRGKEGTIWKVLLILKKI